MQRHGALAARRMMGNRVARPGRHAVACRLDRRVRRHPVAVRLRYGCWHSFGAGLVTFTAGEFERLAHSVCAPRGTKSNPTPSVINASSTAVRARSLK